MSTNKTYEPHYYHRNLGKALLILHDLTREGASLQERIKAAYPHFNAMALDKPIMSHGTLELWGEINHIAGLAKEDDWATLCSMMIELALRVAVDSGAGTMINWDKIVLDSNRIPPSGFRSSV